MRLPFSVHSLGLLLDLCAGGRVSTVDPLIQVLYWPALPTHNSSISFYIE